MKTLAIIAFNRSYKNYIEESIKNIIGHEIEIISYSLEEGIENHKHVDLVITTGVFINDEIIKLFHDTPVIKANRVLTGYNLEKVLMIPNGSRVLLLTTPIEASKELALALNSFGIDKLKYEFYWKEKQVNWDNVDYIITPGMAHLCPTVLKDIIDLGYRALSVNTFAQILNFFNLDMSYLDVFENNYIKLHVETCRKVTNSLNDIEQLSKNQKAILHSIDEGILQTNEKNEIIITNPTINDLFGPNEQLKKNKELQAILHKFNYNSSYCDKDLDWESSNILVNYKGDDIYCNKKIIDFKDQTLNLYTFKKVNKIQALEQSVRRKLHNKGFISKHNFNNIWGNNLEIKQMKIRASKFSTNDKTILITGESGTGKEVLAQAIHNASNRANAPFVGVNFAAISDNLVESELFGYDEGAFTGARKGGKQGFFEIAHGGTIFLDEIGDASIRIQSILLRVLEEKEIIHVGGEKNIPIDVRVIAATNKSLEKMVSDGTFRRDLFFRLNILPIKTVPLRNMKDEVPEFLERLFFEKYNIKKIFNQSMLNYLKSYNWPGNFRELINVVDYIYYSSTDRSYVSFKDLPDYVIQDRVDTRNDHIITEKNSELCKLFKEDPDMYEILLVFDQIYPDSIGRNKIIDIINKSNVYITEGRIRKYMNILKSYDLIESGNTKQGSKITKSGQDILNYLHFSG